MNTLLQQLKKRRLDLGLKQNDMLLRIGVSRQQYQRLESKGNPRLQTLELVAKGLNSEIMLVPNEKLSAVQAILEEDANHNTPKQKPENKKSLADDPWQNLLGDEA